MKARYVPPRRTHFLLTSGPLCSQVDSRRVNRNPCSESCLSGLPLLRVCGPCGIACKKNHMNHSADFAPTTASTAIPEQRSRYPQRSSRLNPLSALMHAWIFSLEPLTRVFSFSCASAQTRFLFSKSNEPQPTATARALTLSTGIDSKSARDRLQLLFLFGFFLGSASEGTQLTARFSRRPRKTCQEDCSALRVNFRVRQDIRDLYMGQPFSSESAAFRSSSASASASSAANSSSWASASAAVVGCGCS